MSVDTAIPATEPAPVEPSAIVAAVESAAPVVENAIIPVLESAVEKALAPAGLSDELKKEILELIETAVKDAVKASVIEAVSAIKPVEVAFEKMMSEVPKGCGPQCTVA